MGERDRITFARLHQAQLRFDPMPPEQNVTTLDCAGSVGPAGRKMDDTHSSALDRLYLRRLLKKIRVRSEYRLATVFREGRDPMNVGSTFKASAQN